MAPNADQVDELVEWHPGPLDAARTSPVAAIAWGMRRASEAKALVFWLWLTHLLIADRLASVLLQPLRTWAESAAAGISPLTHALASARFEASPLRSADLGILASIVALLERPTWSPQPYFVLFYGVLAGSAIAYLHAPRPAPMLAQLGAYGGTYAGRFSRLLGITAVTLWLGLRAVDGLASSVGGETGYWLSVFGVQILVSFLAITVDFARIRTVARDSRSMLLETWRSARFVVRHSASILALMTLLWALGGVLVAGAGLAAAAVGDEFAVAAPLIEQLYVAARLWLRLAMWGAMLSLYQGIVGARLAAGR